MDDLFDRLQMEGEAGIRRLVSERAQENVTLDFKRKRDATKGAFDKDDRATFAEILSGFANSAGGFAIWGVDARKNEDGIDCAQELAPVAGIERFLSEAQGLVSRLVMPRLDGVSLACVRCDHDTSAGYLLVRVERSERRPHRSEAADRKHYFKRSGDSFFVMEHYDIEDAFRRASAPELELSLETLFAGPIKEPAATRRRFIMRVILYNKGNTTAKHPFVQVLKLHALQPGDQTECVLQHVSRYGVTTTYSGGADAVIHPGQSAPAIMFRLDHVMYGGDRMSLGCPPGGNPNFGISLLAGCENARPVSLDLWKEGTEAISFLTRVMQ